jgi:hypothetical protein
MNLVNSSHLASYEDGTECSKTSVYEIQMLGNYPEESMQHSEHGESLKSRIVGNVTQGWESNINMDLLKKKKSFDTMSCIRLAESRGK